MPASIRIIKSEENLVKENKQGLSQPRPQKRNSAHYEQYVNPPNRKPSDQSTTQHADNNTKAVLEQVEMLQKSQELTERSVAPLHITLPCNGTAHHFNQSLQMKSGEPMTLEFVAANTKGPN